MDLEESEAQCLAELENVQDIAGVIKALGTWRKSTPHAPVIHELFLVAVRSARARIRVMDEERIATARAIARDVYRITQGGADT